MISDIEAAHILIYMSRSKPVMEREDRLSVQAPKQKRGERRRRSFPMPSQEDSLSPKKRPPPLFPPMEKQPKKKARGDTSSTAIVEYVSGEEDDSPPMPSLRRKKRASLFPLVEKQPKKKAKVVASSWTTEATPEWLLKLMKEEAEPKRIIEKELKATDISRGHNRLSMPCSNILDLDFLSPSEQRVIEEDEGRKNKTGVNAKLVVKLVDSDVLKKFDVNLRRWRMPKKSGSATFVYNLVTGWNKVVHGCGLDENDKIRLWSFHSDGELCFALTTIVPPPRHPLPLLLLLPPPPPPPSDTEDSKPEEMSSALVIYDKSNDDLQPR